MNSGRARDHDPEVDHGRDEHELDRARARCRATGRRARPHSAQIPQATTLRPSAIRIVRRPIGEASSSIVSRSSLRRRPRCSRRARAAASARRRSPRQRRARGSPSRTIPPTAILATHAAAADEGKRHDERNDEREHIAGAVAEDRAERPAGGDLGGGREPAGAEEIADPEREDVVGPDAAQHECVEAPDGELERVGDPSPAGSLRDVDELDHDHREQHEPDDRRRGARARRRRDRRRGRRARGRTPTRRARSRAGRRDASACPERPRRRAQLVVRHGGSGRGHSGRRGRRSAAEGRAPTAHGRSGATSRRSVSGSRDLRSS